jgi:hypothetical protein
MDKCRTEIYKVMGKIFGIGANKTGTTSLTKALEILGYKISHWQHQTEILTRLIKCQFRYPFLETYDGATDLPIPSIFKELDKAYPNSKFILTIRDPDDWIQSEEHHHRMMGLEKPLFENFLLFGTFHFDKQMFLEAYEKHNQKVQQYFKDRSDLLIMDITAGDGWSKLCTFLNKPMPNQPFPALNVRKK